MNAIPQIMVTGLTLGAMYAIATLGLSLTWGALRLLNMAHGATLALGGYLAYTAQLSWQLPWPLAFSFVAAGGAVLGWLLFWLIARPMLHRNNFETNVIIATVGLGIIIENAILQFYGGQPLAQPMRIAGSIDFVGVSFPLQSIAIIASSIVLFALTRYFLNATLLGRAVRASTQQQTAAQLVGIPVQRMFAITLAIASALTVTSGLMLSSITQLSPLMGADPMLKAFIMCVLAGLGNVGGAIFSAFALAFVEVIMQYLFGARWGFPSLLLLVMVVLVWRPYGIFSGTQVRRQ